MSNVRLVEDTLVVAVVVAMAMAWRVFAVVMLALPLLHLSFLGSLNLLRILST